jgi:putative spermidine/putrescine transport system ATP-binding protein
MSENIDGEVKVAISIKSLTKSFGEFVAVDNLNLEIASGEFFSMLGPSGSGKTTVLRMIAGFELPSSGQVLLFDEDVTKNAPFDREVNTVFQDYALFPHLSVIENVEYGLKVRKISKVERRQLALAALTKVHLADFADRKPAQLSGGQRQRVALARAIVVKPKILLLDEPLGALDLKLREKMQIELKELQRELGITFIFVTHDQDEALTLSDRIAVFNNGKIEQIGTPQELYEAPATEFVARFIGTANVFSAEESLNLFGIDSKTMIRPEQVEVGTGEASAIVKESIYLGSAIRLILDFQGHQVIAELSASNDLAKSYRRGATVKVNLSKTDLVTLK